MSDICILPHFKLMPEDKVMDLCSKPGSFKSYGGWYWFCYNQGRLKALFLADFSFTYGTFCKKKEIPLLPLRPLFLYISFYVPFSIFAPSLCLCLNISFHPVGERREKGVMLAQVLDCQRSHLRCIYVEGKVETNVHWPHTQARHSILTLNQDLSL